MRVPTLFRRVAMLILVIWVAGTLNFFIPKFAPRNPIEDKLLAEIEHGGSSVDLSSLVEAYNKKFGLDTPLFQQYLTYLGDMVTFDLGYSIAYYPTRTIDLIGGAMPWTIGLLTTTTVLGFLIGTVLGALTVWQGSARLYRLLVPVLMVGHARGEALLLAAERRFRPIMMTAITTIGGLVPLALAGRGSIGISYTSFSLALIGGMSTATLLTLLVVPVFYTLFDDMRLAFGGALVRVIGWRRRSSPAASQEMG